LAIRVWLKFGDDRTKGPVSSAGEPIVKGVVVAAPGVKLSKQLSAANARWAVLPI
jgi:hypothetical protein